MRPKSLIEQMNQAEGEAQGPDDGPGTAEMRGDEMTDLVDRLCSGDHPVEVSIRPKATVRALKECLDRGYVHVRFTDTRGGTELGVGLDRDRSDLIAAELESEEGRVRIVGNLTLDYVKVRCIANVDISTMRGTGVLERC
jgi:hypothetical protein